MLIYIFALTINYTNHPDHNGNYVYGLPVQYIEKNISWLRYKKRSYQAALTRLEGMGFISPIYYAKKKHYFLTGRGNQLWWLLYKNNEKFSFFTNEELMGIKI